MVMIAGTIKQQSHQRVSFIDMSGDILDLISEYLPSRSETDVPPRFTMCSSKIMKNYCEYKRENYGI